MLSFLSPQLLLQRIQSLLVSLSFHDLLFSLLHYEQCSISTVCGEFLFINGGETMVVSTLNYPGNYTNNAKCFYGIICSAKNVKLTMNFTAFDVEPSTNCSNDVVIIHDGTRLDSPVLDRICGARASLKKAPIYVSSGVKFLLQFHTNDKITRKGFQAAVSCPCKAFVFELMM